MPAKTGLSTTSSFMPGVVPDRFQTAARAHSRIRPLPHTLRQPTHRSRPHLQPRLRSLRPTPVVAFAQQKLDRGRNVLCDVAHSISALKRNWSGEHLLRSPAYSGPGRLRRILRRFSPARRRPAHRRLRHRLQTIIPPTTRSSRQRRSLCCRDRLLHRLGYSVRFQPIRSR
jgi:hypothetical protein